MREFNTFGPVNPKLHYHVNRVAVKAVVRRKIEQGRYFTLNAPQQSGKTTLFRQVVAELEAEGTYFSLVLDFETLRGYNRDEFYGWLKQKIIQFWRARHGQLDPILPWLRDFELQEQNSFGELLRHLGQQLAKPGLLIIDEFDAIGPELAEPLLAVFQEMYLNRDEPTFHAPQSIILVGVRNIPTLLGDRQFLFNIADQYQVPYFTAAETTDLLTQHTAETGQSFAPEVVEAIYRETGGQPFLVNRLGQILTHSLVSNREETIRLPHFEGALALLLAENNTHFAAITAQARPHRSLLLPMLFYDHKRSNFRDPVTQELLISGLLRPVREDNLWLARLANPIYRKMLILAFTPAGGEMAIDGNLRHHYLVDGLLDMDKLLDAFQRMIVKPGVRLLRGKRTDPSPKIGGQYFLLSYLTAALDGLGGHVTLKSVNPAGELNLLVFYRRSRFIIATKIWHGSEQFEAAQRHLVSYLQSANLDKGYIILFSQQKLEGASKLKAIVPFEVTALNKKLRIYPIVIGR